MPIWKINNFDLYFYFGEIFEKALAALSKRTINSGLSLVTGEQSKYKALIVPVGFKIENVALMASLLKPSHLTVVFSAITRNFHRRHFGYVEKKIIEHCAGITIDVVAPVESDDHRHMEDKVLTWYEKMRIGYGFSNDQLAVDLTGGTKPMTVGAQNAAMSLGIPAFYLSVDYDAESQQAIPGTELLLEMPTSQSQTDEKLVFVIMSFKAEYDGVYQSIKDAAGKCPEALTCMRVDDEIYSGGIMDKVREEIARAGVVVAELTERNANVYYELGLAHALEKEDHHDHPGYRRNPI